MTCSFLEAKDYPVELSNGEFDTTPTEAFTPSVDNTVVVEFKVSEAFPTFKETYIDPARKFWRDHVLTGISPAFDEKKDAEILKVLRKNTVEPTSDEISKLIAEGEKLQAAIDKAEDRLADKRKRLKEIDDAVKKFMSSQFRDGDKKVEIAGKRYSWTLTKSSRASFDSKALAKDLPDVYDKYAGKTETYSLKKTAIEEA